MIPVGILTAAATSSFAYLLDLYPSAVAAYSLRKLKAGYTGNSIQVRRSSDNSTQNIGFVNNVLDTSSLLIFCGSGNGFVTIWYDQSGSGNNAIQNTAAAQARIVFNGAITYQNGNPVINFFGTGIFYLYTPIIATGNISLFMVQKRVGQSVILSNTTGGVYFGQQSDNNFYFQRVNGTLGFYRSSPDSTFTFCILNGYSDSSGMSAYKNNTQYTLTTELSFPSSVTTFNSIGNYAGLPQSTGIVTEIIIYTINQTTNRIGINANINSFYTIF